MPASRPSGTDRLDGVRPIVTLTTDFGLADSYVAEMKAAVLTRCPEATLVDVTHLLPPQDVTAGALVLGRTLSAFPPGTVHLAVVDPGVGSARRLLASSVAGQFVVCPDNGLITWLARTSGPVEAFSLPAAPHASATFHGRDIMAPAAATIARAGRLPRNLRPVPDLALLPLAPAPFGATSGDVIAIDHFGNAITNLMAVPAGRTIRVGRRNLGPPCRTYADVPPGRPLALIGSSGLLEIAVRDGSAMQRLGLRVGDRVRLDRNRLAWRA